VRLVGRGHPAIRATHTKTLELTPDAEVTERATCVVAVHLDRQRRALAGDVQLTLRAGTESFTFAARANSAWDPNGTAVIRRSPLRLPGTFATHASAAAADLPRTLVAAAADPRTTVELDVEPLPGRPCAVLFAMDATRPVDARLEAELAAADLVVAEDDDAANAIGERVSRGPVELRGRVLVLATRDLPGASIAAQLAGVDVETVGLPPLLAAAAASPSRTPLVVAAPDADLRTVLRDAPVAARVALSLPAEQLDAVLRMAADARGSAHGVLVQPHAQPVRIDVATAPAHGTVYLCFDADTGEAALGPRIRAAIEALVSDGVATKTAAAALAALTGWERRRAYAAVLALRDAEMGNAPQDFGSEPA
jgi:hypothetical protein